jgi:hypothetical protein
MAIDRSSQNWPDTVEVSDETTVIPFTRELVIKNTAMLAPGLGLNYLACIQSHIQGEYIAKKWYRQMPKHEAVVIVFGGAL